jgi:hypothetical protein
MVCLFQSLFKTKHLIGYATARAEYAALDSHAKRVNESLPDNSTILELASAISPVLDRLCRGLREDFEVLRLSKPAKSTGSTESVRSVGGKSGRLVRAFHGVRARGKAPDIKAAWWEHVDESGVRLPLNRVDQPPKGEGGRRFEHASSEPDAYVQCEEAVSRATAVLQPDGTYQFEMEFSYPETELDWHAFVVGEALRDIEEGSSGSANITAVCESAAKVRVVTSSSSAGATYVRMWQECIFKRMRELGCFPSLSGEVTAIQVESIMSRLGGDGWFAASSDFTSATDLLNPEFTNWILRYLTQGFAGREIIMDDNADKTLDYPLRPRLATERHPLDQTVVAPDGKRYVLSSRGAMHWWGGQAYELAMDSFEARKTCGQLMGQGTSFPLLCLVNLACTVAAYRRSGISWREAIGLVIINGDDRLACSNDTIERDFWSLAEPIGLRKSAGKSYEHPSFACINSRDYVFKGGRWVRAEAIRVNLLYGLKKLREDAFNPATVVTALFESVPLYCQSAVISTFLKYHVSELRRACAGRNLFLPVAVGGMGQVKPPAWEDCRLTDFQRRLAEHFVSTQVNNCFEFGPQLPSEQPLNPSSFGWDQVESAAWKPDLVADELLSFSKKYTFRRLSSLGTEVSRVCPRCLRDTTQTHCVCGWKMRTCPYEVQKTRTVERPCRTCEDARPVPLPLCRCAVPLYVYPLRVCRFHVEGHPASFREERPRCEACTGVQHFRPFAPGIQPDYVEFPPCKHNTTFEKTWWECPCHGLRDDKIEVGRVFRLTDEQIWALSRPTTVRARQRPGVVSRTRDTVVTTWAGQKLCGADASLFPEKIRLPAESEFADKL